MHKRTINVAIAILMLSLHVYANDVSRRVSMLIKGMADSQGKYYITSRDTIVAAGEEILPQLKQIAVDLDRGWRERLAARICFERIVRGDKIMELRNSDWTGLYNKYATNNSIAPSEEEHVTSLESTVEGEKSKPNSEGVQEIMSPISNKELDRLHELVDRGRGVKPTKQIVIMGIRAPINAEEKYHHLKDEFTKGSHKLGTWYYFIELTWKNTGETATNCKLGKSFDKQWVEWCRDVVRGQPEEIWLCRAIADHLRTADFSDWREQKLYSRSLHECGCPELIPVLCERYEDFYKAIISGSTLKAQMEQSPDRYRNDIEKLMKYADKRHVEALSKIINENAVFASLRSKLQDIKERSASPQPKEVFRIGHRIVP